MIPTAPRPLERIAAARNFASHELARARALPREDTITVCCEVIHGDAWEYLARRCPVPLVIVPCPTHAIDPVSAR